MLFEIDPPKIIGHPISDDVPMGKNVTLECKATGLGSLKFSWERQHAGNWIIITTDNSTSYTAKTSGLYMCMVSIIIPISNM